MQLWRYVLAGSVCSALAFIPQETPTKLASMPVMNSAPELASLRLEKVMQTNALPMQAPISFFSSSSKPLSGITICVDPGHGGQSRAETAYTGGTIGVVTHQTEGDVNLRVGLILRQYLEAAGAKVLMTRVSDNRCQGDTCKRDELDFRSNMANANRADLFISVHHNETDSNHTTNYTAAFFPASSAASVPLAENVSMAVSKYLGTENVGARKGDYRVLNHINMPGIICEASFMSNPNEDQRLASLAYNKLEAKAIATGVLNYVRLSKGRTVDFRTIFAPIDSQAGSAQQMADASFVRHQVVEQKSLFGVRYEELTYDKTGRVAARREVGNSSLAARRESSKSESNSSSKGSVKTLISSVPEKGRIPSHSSKTRIVLSRKDAIGSSKPIISSSKSSSKKKEEISKAVKSTKSPGRSSTSIADAKSSRK